MDRASYFVAREINHLHGFIHYTLTCKGCITVNNEGNYSITSMVT